LIQHTINKMIRESRSWSPIWNFFYKNPEDVNKAHCKTCFRELKIPCGTTSPLGTHLKYKHIEQFNVFEELRNEQKRERIAKGLDPPSILDVKSKEEKSDLPKKPSDEITELSSSNYSEQEKMNFTMDENMKLSRPNYSDHLKEMLQIIRMKTELSDVTLVCEDKQQFKAHKIVLSACSPVFDSIINGLNNQNPVIYLMGVKGEDLDPILQFMYLGEVTVSQSRMKDFLETAYKFEIKELGQTVIKTEQEQIDVGDINELFMDKGETSLSSTFKSDIDTSNSTLNESEVDYKSVQKELKELALETHDNNNKSGLLATNESENKDKDKEAEALLIAEARKAERMRRRKIRRYQCDKCEYNANLRSNLTRHIEGVHEGIKNMCPICGKSYSGVDNLSAHTKAMHGDKKYPCDICGYVGKCKSNWRSHMKHSHTVKVWNETQLKIWEESQKEEKVVPSQPKIWEESQVEEKVFLSQPNTWKESQVEEKVALLPPKIWEESQVEEKVALSLPKIWEEPQVEEKVVLSQPKVWEESQVALPQLDFFNETV